MWSFQTSLETTICRARVVRFWSPFIPNSPFASMPSRTRWWGRPNWNYPRARETLGTPLAMSPEFPGYVRNLGVKILVRKFNIWGNYAAIFTFNWGSVYFAINCKSSAETILPFFFASDGKIDTELASFGNPTVFITFGPIKKRNSSLAK